MQLAAGVIYNILCPFIALLPVHVTRASELPDMPNFDVVSYGLTPPVILSALPQMRPGYDMGAEYLRKEYGFNVTITYLSSSEAKTCADLPDHLDLVYDYYYKRHNERDAFALILPGCDDLVLLGKIAREWNVPMLSCGPTSDLRDRHNYPTSVNDGPMQMSMLAEVFLRIFEHFSWFSVALLVDMGTPAPFFRMWIEALKGQLSATINSKIILHDQRFSSKLEVDYSSLLLQASKVSRVIVISSFPRMVRNFMIRAHEAGMTNGDYVYLSLEPFQNQRYFGNLTWQNYDLFDEIAREAFRSLKQVSPCYQDIMDNKSNEVEAEIMRELVRRTQAVYNYSYGPGELPNPFLLAAYQSMELFGNILNESRHLANITQDGRLFISQMTNKSIDLQSGTVLIGEYGEKRADYCVNALSPKTYRYTAVIKYHATTGSFSNLTDEIDWANDLQKPPSNQPPCGYLGVALSCRRKAWNDYFTAVLAVLLLLTLSLVLFAYCSFRAFWAKNHSIWWSISSDNLLLQRRLTVCL